MAQATLIITTLAVLSLRAPLPPDGRLLPGVDLSGLGVAPAAAATRGTSS